MLRKQYWKPCLCALWLLILCAVPTISPATGLRNWHPLNIEELVGAWEGFAGGPHSFMIFHSDGTYELYDYDRDLDRLEKTSHFAGLFHVEFGSFSIGFEQDNSNEIFLILDGYRYDDTYFYEGPNDEGLILATHEGEGGGDYIRAKSIPFLPTWEALIGTWDSEDGVTVFQFFADGSFTGEDAQGNVYRTPIEHLTYTGSFLPYQDHASRAHGMFYLLQNAAGVLRIARTKVKPLEEDLVYYLTKQ